MKILVFALIMFALMVQEGAMGSIHPSQVLSPVIGDIEQIGPDGECSGTKWCFNQHQTYDSSNGIGHTVGGGICGISKVEKTDRENYCADDSYAWDANLYGFGQDGDANQPVYAVDAGVVCDTYGGASGGSYGQVLIEHSHQGNKWWSGYLHLENIQVSKGQSVTTDTIIGNISNKGVPDRNNHLHFVVYTGENVPGKLRSFDAQIVPRLSVDSLSTTSVADDIREQAAIEEVALTLFVRDGSASGPVISGAEVTGEDAAGSSFYQITDSNGLVVIRGLPGTWYFTATKPGYAARSWSQEITTTCTKHAFLISGESPVGPVEELAAHVGSVQNYSQEPHIISEDGINFIANHEGFVDRLYNDPGNHCTIGYGHLVHKGVCDGADPSEQEFLDGVTEERAIELFRADLAEAERAVNTYVTVPLNQAQFDALVSFAYNVGSGNFRDSALLGKLNEGDYQDVPEQLNLWVYSSGKLMPGLVIRRQDEGNLFQYGIYGIGEMVQDLDQVVPSESIIFAGIPLELKDGYEIVLKAVDIDGNKIYFELSKDGQIVDSSVIRPPKNVNATYAYTKDKGQAGAVPLIIVHFKNAFRGEYGDITTIDSVCQVSESDPSNVIRNNNDAITLTSKEPLRLEEGFELALKAADFDGSKVYIELSKDGRVVDSSIIIPPNEFDESYSYTKDKGQVDAVQIIRVHFKNGFRGVDQNIATVDGIWQVSENDPSNIIKTSSDEITLTSSEPLKLEEGFELAIRALDFDGNRVYIELVKDGQVVDSSVIMPPNNVETTYTYIEEEGQTWSAPAITVHFKNSFHGLDLDLATIENFE